MIAYSLNCPISTPGPQVQTKNPTLHMYLTAHLWLYAKSPPDMQINYMHIENTVNRLLEMCLIDK